MPIYFQNTLTGKKDEFKSLYDKKIGMYNCGPTVYNYAHIGNLRAYVFADTIKRMFEWNGYKVYQVINITDVGHLTSDNDEGIDKIEKVANKEHKTTREISEFFTKSFHEDLKLLNIDTSDTIFPKATEHILEQIALIQKLEHKGFTYKTSDGIYFNTAKFKNYGKLGHINLKGLREGERVKKNLEKKNSTDFAVWKFSRPEEKRQQEWLSPWGIGFPGWHIECSAMSMRYLGETFDIHTGGIDHIPIHHNNEIAQSESATGKPFANYWMHNAFVNIENEKMAKSENNFIRLTTLIERGIHPLSYRYMLLNSHYSTPMIFNWEAIKGSQASFEKIIRDVMHFIQDKSEHGKILQNYKEKFIKLINNDLDTPKVLATLHNLLDDKKVSSADKLKTILDLDKTLGLNIEKITKQMIMIPEEILNLNKKRDIAREKKDFQTADSLRKKIESLGYNIYDFTKNSLIERKLSSLIK